MQIARHHTVGAGIHQAIAQFGMPHMGCHAVDGGLHLHGIVHVVERQVTSGNAPRSRRRGVGVVFFLIWQVVEGDIAAVQRPIGHIHSVASQVHHAAFHHTAVHIHGQMQRTVGC